MKIKHLIFLKSLHVAVFEEEIFLLETSVFCFEKEGFLGLFRCALLLLGAHLSRSKQCVGLLRAASAC
jgi:hypothetical protein